MTDWIETFLGTLFPSVPTPYNDRRHPNLDALRAYADWMKRQPIDGVAVSLRTGEGDRFDSETCAEILECWKAAMEGLPLIVEVGPDPKAAASDAISTALDIANVARDTARYFLLKPPTVFCSEPDRDSRIIDYHRSIGELGIPLIVSCTTEGGDGMRYSDDVVETLFDMDEVVAGRISMIGSPVLLQDLITHLLVNHPDKAVLSGDDRLCGYSLYRGCHGTLSAVGSICPRLQRELIDAWFMGEATRFLNLSRLTDHVAEAIFIEPIEGYARRLLVGLAYQRIIPEESADDPWAPPISPRDEELVKATLDAIGEWSDGRC